MKLVSRFFPAALWLIAGSLFAQGPGGGRRNAQPLPLQGKDLPEVKAFDSEGKLVDLRQILKGRHGVIVFGCLT